MAGKASAMPLEAVLCPNCSSLVAGEPVVCARCGYRSTAAREYFWIYLGGAAFVFFGFLVGAVGIGLEGTAAGHWSRGFEGWFPAVVWPRGYVWLGFLVVGICLTGCGLGITKRSRAACGLLLALLGAEAAQAALAVAGILGAGPPAALPAAVLGAAAVFLALALRIGLALLKTPRRAGLPHLLSRRQTAGGDPESAA